MKTYYISVSPCPSIGHGYVAIGETANHAVAELSLSLRQSIILCEAHIQGEKNTADVEIWKRQKAKAIEILRCIRKPGRICYGFSDTKWIKLKVKEVTKAITVAYVQDVWLGNT